MPELCSGHPKSETTQIYENFAETLIYEQIGSYLLKSLVSLYLSDEIDFRQKCVKIYELHQKNLVEFNKYFSAEFPEDLLPTKSALLFKVLLKCQLPFEMYYTLHETAI